MLKVAFKNGFILDSIASVREQINLESKKLELSITLNNDFNLMTIYSNLIADQSLDAITITNTEEEAESILIGYKNIIALERIIDVVNNQDIEFFKTIIRLSTD